MDQKQEINFGKLFHHLQHPSNLRFIREGTSYIYLFKFDRQGEADAVVGNASVDILQIPKLSKDLTVVRLTVYDLTDSNAGDLSISVTALAAMKALII